MFTGIVEAIGVLQSITKHGKEGRIVISAPTLDYSDVLLGDSIACNGVCVTVVELTGSGFVADISHETIKCTTFSGLTRGSKINLEKALTPTKHLGGHIVQGHVDGVGTVLSITEQDEVTDIWIHAPTALARYIAHKGSITVDGISLTVNEVKEDDFRLTLIPHTHGITTADEWTAGRQVNLEVDVLARYLERLFAYKMTNTDKNTKGVSMQTLIESGFF